MSPARAAVFAAELAEQLATRHIDGRACGPLSTAIRVETVDAVAHPVLTGPGTASGPHTPADDVHEVGMLLAYLLGAHPTGVGAVLAPPGGGVPPQLWSVVLASQDQDPAVRPTAAVLARLLRDCARDILLGTSQHQTRPDPQAPVPGYVPHTEMTDQPPTQARAIRRRTVLLAGVGVAAVLVATVGAVLTLRGTGGDSDNSGRGTAPASASATTQTPPIRVCLPNDCAARGTFRADGDHFIVCDNKADSLSAVIVYRSADSPTDQLIWASRGQGTCVDQKADLRKGSKVTFKVCTGDRDKNRFVQCSGEVTGTA